MNSFQTAPSQLQTWWSNKAGSDYWLSTQFELSNHVSPEQLISQIEVLKSQLELLRIKLVEHQELRIPVQQLLDQSDDNISYKIDYSKADFDNTLKGHQAAVEKGEFVLTIALLVGEKHTVNLYGSQSHFDNQSMQILASLLSNNATDVATDQYIDFSEWLNQGFNEQNNTVREFWKKRFDLPTIAVSQPMLTPMCTTTKKIQSQAIVDTEHWPEQVLSAWLHTLSTRFNISDTFRIDRLLSYRELGELDNMIGPLQVRVPTLANLNVDDVVSALIAEKNDAIEHLDSFDLVSNNDITPTLVFEVSDNNIRSTTPNGVLWLQVSQAEQTIDMTLHYKPSYISSELADVLLEATCSALNGEQSIGPIEAQLQHKFGQGNESIAAVDPIEMLYKNAQSEPEADTIIANGKCWTRKQLWARIEQISAALLSKGVSEGEKVGILLNKDFDAIATIFAILNINAVYVPLDPLWPLKRINHIIEDAKLSAVVSNSIHCELYSQSTIECLLIDQISLENIDSLTIPPATISSPLAYVLYTSGSTGQPKGVAIPRLALSNLANAFQSSIYKGQPIDKRRLTVNAPLTFDASLKQIAMILLGGTLWLVNEQMRRQPILFLTELQKDKIDILDCTPTHLNLLLDASSSESLPLPKTVLVGGENIDANLWQRMSELENTRFINVYGPTEANVVSTWSEVQADLQPGIGRPLPGCKIWLRDQQGHSVATGAIGEIWIGGNRIAEGYVGQPQKTSEVFVPAPESCGDIAYRTGDQARWLFDGRLAFCGRDDDQIKLRGHRIELGEIEATIKKHRAVTNAVAIPKQDNNGEIQLSVFAQVPGKVLNQNELLPDGRQLTEQTKLETDYLYKEIFIDETYAAHGMILPENGVVIDIGANIGMFSIWAKHRWPSAQIDAYEPVPDVARACSNNLASFEGVTFHQQGISDSKGELEFVHYKNYSMMSGCATGANSDAEREVIRTQLNNQLASGDESKAELLEHLDQLLKGRFDAETLYIPVNTLSEELSKMDVSEIHLLKIDVQRSELAVLNGLTAKDLAKVQQITMEVHDAVGTPTQGRIEEITELLEDAGFEVRINQENDLQGTDRYTLAAWRQAWRNQINDSSKQSVSCHIDELWSLVELNLPAYARPHNLHIVEMLPTTHNGKIDRIKLSEQLNITPTSDAHVAPSTPIEQKLVDIWSAILAIENIGVEDNFFRLGGDSLNGIRIQVEARETGLILELNDLFECQTISKLAQRTTLEAPEQIEQQTLAAFELINDPQIKQQQHIEDAYPMSGLQLGMVFHTELTNSPNTYHNVTARRLQAPFEPEAFTLAWSQCVSRHQTLRTSFSLSANSQPLQLIHKKVNDEPEYHDWSNFTPDELDLAVNELFRRELERPFDLNNPPLVRLRLCKLANQELLLIVAEYHAILDGLSLELMRNELLDRYKAIIANHPLQVTPLSCRPIDFIKLECEALNSDLTPWQAVLKGAQPVRIGKPLMPVDVREYDHIRTPISSSLFKALSQKASKMGVHLKHILLAVHARVLGEITNTPDVVTGLVVHGRPEQRDGASMLGLFIHTLPIRLNVEALSWSELITNASKEDFRVQRDRNLPLWVLKREFGQSANIPTFFNFVSFESTASTFDVIDEKYVGVDVDVDLAVDFVCEADQLILLHQQPKASADALITSKLIESTISVLEAAADPNDLWLSDINHVNVESATQKLNGLKSHLPSASSDLIKIVTSVIGDILEIDPPSPKESFQSLGGHSLKALEATHKLRELTQTTLPLTSFLAAETLEELASIIETKIG